MKRLALTPLEARDVPATYDLGGALDFNAFFFTAMDAFTSDVEGRVAVGGDAKFYAYGIGDRLENSNGTRDDLIVGNNLEYTYGQVFNGNLVYGNTADLEGVGLPNGDERQEAGVVDFAAVQADLTDTSAVLGAETPNGRTRVKYTTAHLRGTHDELNIFSITAEQLAAANRVSINVPQGSTVLINVSGDAVTITNLGFRLRGAGCSTILWNMYEADTLTMSGIGMVGSILAPTAALDFNNGNVKGTVVADSMVGNGQFNLCPSEVSIDIPDYASIRGFVFLDENRNNLRDDPAIETGIDDFEVILTGTDSLGRNIERSLMSFPEGAFNFGALWPGTYKVRVVPTESQPSELLGIPGTVDGAPVGTAQVNAVVDITLGEGDEGIEYLLPIPPIPF